MFSGRWNLRGKRIFFNQTHEDGNEKSDSMKGSFDGQTLRLDHEDDGMVMKYVLHRETPGRTAIGVSPPPRRLPLSRRIHVRGAPPTG